MCTTLIQVAPIFATRLPTMGVMYSYKGMFKVFEKAPQDRGKNDLKDSSNLEDLFNGSKCHHTPSTSPVDSRKVNPTDESDPH